MEDRRDRIGQQQLGDGVGVVAEAVADADLDVVAIEVHHGRRAVDLDVDVGMTVGEALQARNQPVASPGTAAR